MKDRVSRIGILFSIYTLPFLVLLFIWNDLPQEIPMHWNSSGEITAYESKQSSAIFAIVFNFLLFLLVVFIPKDFSTKIVMMTIFSLIPNFAFIYSLDISWNFKKIIAGLFSILLVITGLKFRFNPPKRNAIFGIRTPMTMKNDKNWQIAHHLGGLVLAVGGILLLLISLLISSGQLQNVFIIGAIVLLVITLVVTHFKIYQQN